jgi:hypothetical protein
MTKDGSKSILLAVVAAGLVLSACDEAEQDRILFYQKGEYMGAPDSALSEDTLQALRQRAARQKGE